MSKFTTFANDLLDAEYDTGASGTLALGPVSARVNYTLPFKARLTTTVSTAGTPGTAVSGGSYADQSIAGSMAAASGGSKASNAALTYTGMPACTWADVMVVDSTGTPKNMTFRGGSSLAKTVNAGDTALIPSGSFTGTEA
jgi:hypothetical protein